MFFIIDDTQTLERAKKMAAVGKLHHHATGKYGRNVLHNSGRWCNIVGLRKRKAHYLADRVGQLGKLGTVKVVFSRRKGEAKHTALVTDDLNASMKTIVAEYLKRWSIEDTFKNTKQLLGGQHPQTFKGKGPERAAGLSLWLYSMAWLWYLKQKSKHRYFIVQPWNPLKSTPSFADAIACLRRELWAERIKYMFGVSAESISSSCLNL